MLQPVQNATIRLAVEMGLPEAIVQKREGITASELSNSTEASKMLIGTVPIPSHVGQPPAIQPLTVHKLTFV